jgi:cobalt-precorrin 5A hydrolase
MREGIAFVVFSDAGEALAARLQRALGGTVSRAGAGGVALEAWTAEMFSARRALVFVGAAGIAVRAVAPHLRHKAVDPAVVALDEAGRFVIPLLSGHLGGANDLARELAALCGGTAVITTATDVRGVFAVDSWARRQRLSVTRPERIKTVSARLLRGETVRLFSRWPIAGQAPEGVAVTADRESADIVVDVCTGGAALCLVPQGAVLGLGCRAGVSAEDMEAAFEDFCAARGVSPRAIAAAASIDRKAEEPGLLAFCRGHGWPVTFFAAEELRETAGTFAASAFVERTVGVDNVCERSAVRASGGALLAGKYAAGGVTLALAMAAPALDWEW